MIFSVPKLIFLGLTWVKVFNHDTRDGMFPYGDDHPHRSDVVRFNDDDPDAYRFSILDEVENTEKMVFFI